MNTSSTGGYLLPAGTSPPLEDAELEALLQQMIAGISGLPVNMVRSRWQPAATPPAATDNWCAVGITSQANDAGAVIRHDPAGDGKDVYTRQQELTLLCSFYGPNAMRYAHLLVDGLCIPQNNEVIGAQGMHVVEAEAVRTLSETVNQQVVLRYELSIRLRRRIERSYPVLHLLSARLSTATDGRIRSTSINLSSK